eukprot:CAMPEP_0196780510 /NCGR_PEP_ID=MMETSP1104-20130614/7937_1 /TAXON_ID=33652 /ORGANISM="Cafeteria sp., Strain Caron Lab Isolate" /LENGTH=317 /DNA_ID=CAMNT_0042150721 /DNA_START=63 /DNA_END=1016 /DNA_ORIENTATION=+
MSCNGTRVREVYAGAVFANGSCMVSSMESQLCNVNAGAFGDWGACSATCGAGIQTRSKACGGKQVTEQRVCNTNPCPVPPPPANRAYVKAQVTLSGYTVATFTEHRDDFRNGTAMVLGVSIDAIVIEEVVEVTSSVSSASAPSTMRVSVLSTSQGGVDVKFRVEVPVAEATQKAAALKTSVTQGTLVSSLQSAGLSNVGTITLKSDPTVQTPSDGGDDGPNVALIVSLTIVGVLLVAGGVGFYLWRRRRQQDTAGGRQVLSTPTPTGGAGAEAGVSGRSATVNPAAGVSSSSAKGPKQFRENPLLASVEMSDRRAQV